MTSPAISTRPRRPWPSWLAPALLLLLAAALRLPRLGFLEPDVDENYSVVMARWPAGVLSGALNDTNPPFYLYLLKGWMALWGVEAGPLRSLSLVVGLAQLAALGALLARLGFMRRAALWAMALGAISPIHIYYSQVARSYTLSWLLLTLALWSFGAARGPSPLFWALHGLFLVLALYTHNLFVLLIPVFVLGAWILRFGRREWIRLAVTYLAVGLAYLPWLLLTMRNVEGGLAWVADNWSPGAAPRLIPASLEVMGAGTHFPAIVRMVSPPGWLRGLALAWLALMVVAFFMRIPPEGGTPKLCGMGVSAANRQLLLLFALAPLVLMLAYSLVVRPIYVVGRYDTLAFPALLALLGLGASRMQAWIENSSKARGLSPLRASVLPALLVGLIPLLVTASVMREKLRPIPSNVNIHPQATRGELLRDYLQPGDAIVCLGLEGTRILYQLERLGLSPRPRLLTFPPDTQKHLGYFVPRQAGADPDRLRREAAALVERAFSPAPRLWLALDPYSFRPGETEYTAIAQVLLDALAARRFKEWQDPQFMSRARKLGLRIYIPQ